MEYEDEAVEAVVRLEAWLSSATAGGPFESEMERRTSSLPQVPTLQHKKSVRLPKLDLLQFSGDLKA